VVADVSGTIRRLARSSVTHVAFAFAAMGGWAVFANRAHPASEALVAGLLQGALSAATTLVLKKAVEALAARLTGLTALLLPPLAAGLISAAVLTASHRLAGTPEILATVALPLSVATSYAAIWSYALWSDRKAIGHARR
jgi:hypothetical protein